MFKVSSATVFVRGLVGPKPRLKGVGDGQQVNIPVLLMFRYQLRRDRGGEADVPIGRHPSNKVEWLGKSGHSFPDLSGWIQVVMGSFYFRVKASSAIPLTGKSSK